MGAITVTGIVTVRQMPRVPSSMRHDSCVTLATGAVLRARTVYDALDPATVLGLYDITVATGALMSLDVPSAQITGSSGVHNTLLPSLVVSWCTVVWLPATRVKGATPSTLTVARGSTMQVGFDVGPTGAGGGVGGVTGTGVGVGVGSGTGVGAGVIIGGGVG
jgi:hypothetical protein